VNGENVTPAYVSVAAADVPTSVKAAHAAAARKRRRAVT
jgi:hypothetical protein